MEQSIKQPKNALNAGLLYLVLIIVGMYGFAYVFPQIIIEGNIIETIENIKNNQSLFRVGIVCILVMNIVSIVLVIILHQLLSPVHKGMANFMLFLLLVGAGISLLNEVNHFATIIVNTNTHYFADNLNIDLTALFIGMQKYGSYIAVIFWGLWLFPLGGLIYKLGTKISKFIGIMLFIAGIGYLIDSYQIFLTFKGLRFVASDYTFFGELLLTIWLLFKSKKIEQLATGQRKAN